MPYENLDSEVMVAFAIWLLAICLFTGMLVLAIVEIISENRTRMHLHPRTGSNRWDSLRHIAVSMFHRKK